MFLDNAYAVGEEYDCPLPQFGIDLASDPVMEAIGKNENGPVHRAYTRNDAVPLKGAASPSDAATKAKLTDISKIAEQASRTGEEVRPEAIQRAKSLLADPNWPNDAVIEGLAEKLLSTDDFVS